MQCYCTFLSLALGTFIILLTVLRVGFIRYLPFTIRFVNVAVAFCFLPLSTRTVISADRVIQKETQHNNCLHWRSCFLLLLLLLFFFFFFGSYAYHPSHWHVHYLYVCGIFYCSFCGSGLLGFIGQLLSLFPYVKLTNILITIYI